MLSSRFSLVRILLSLLSVVLISVIIQAPQVASLKQQSSSIKKGSTYHRRLQQQEQQGDVPERDLQKDNQQRQNDNNKNNKNTNNNKNDNKNDPPVVPPSFSPTIEPTAPPTSPPSPSPTVTPTKPPTPSPTENPTVQPTSLAPATAVMTAMQVVEKEEPSTSSALTSYQNPPTTATNNEDDPFESSTTVALSSSQVTLDMDQLRDIQYFGGADVTLRFSLWFQDGTLTNEVSGNVELAVLYALQTLLCQSDDENVGTTGDDDSTNNNNEGRKKQKNEQDGTEEASGFLNTATYDMATPESTMEERELCVLKHDLNPKMTNDDNRNTMLEGSILLQPPTTWVVDRSATTTTDATSLHWTTWRVTFPVLRLGTFYILQGLENSAAGSEGEKQAAADGDLLSTEEIYGAGVQAMQQVLELALQVGIREQALDKLLLGNLVDFSGRDDTTTTSASIASATAYGLVLASVYGEELSTFAAKLDWLGISENGASAETTTGTSGTPFASGSGDLVEPSNINNSTGTLSGTATAEAADGVGEDDDEWDDDRYSLEYGITESLDPPFWHPLRIVGIFMFVMTMGSLVGLSCTSKKRQARKALERRLLANADKEGLLNNAQGVEDMLRRTAPTASKSASYDTDDNKEHYEREEQPAANESDSKTML